MQYRNSAALALAVLIVSASPGLGAGQSPGDPEQNPPGRYIAMHPWLQGVSKVTAAPGTLAVNESRTCGDPVIAARTAFRLGEDWGLSLRGGVDGFRPDPGCTWEATGMIGYKVTGVFSINVGYTVVGVERIVTTAPAVRLGVVRHGPFVGFGISF